MTNIKPICGECFWPWPLHAPSCPNECGAKAIILAASLALPACATLSQPDLEQRIIAAATKCIADATTVLSAQREYEETHNAAIELLRMQREANDKQCDGAPDAAKATPLQSRKP